MIEYSTETDDIIIEVVCVKIVFQWYFVEYLSII